MRIALLLTCHNRLDQTLACLDRIFRQELPKNVSTEVFLVDDGSTDGTGDAVRQHFPQVHILEGTGNLFWTGGMRMAYEAAESVDPDFYLWLNDDVELYGDALGRLLSTCDDLLAAGEKMPIVIGTTRDPATLAPTYGGVLHCSRWHPMKFRLVMSDHCPVRCDTFNGNCVLVSRLAAECVGNLDSVFTHGMGDFDYGLRAWGLGCPCWVAPGFVGTCARGGSKRIWEDSSSSLRLRWRALCDIRGLPPKEYRAYLRRHGGRLWLFYWLLPYLKTLVLPLLPEKSGDRAGSGLEHEPRGRDEHEL